MLILIPKPDIKVSEPRSYRPICLLVSFVICPERLLYGKLLNYVVESEGLAERQYSFWEIEVIRRCISLIVNMAKRDIEWKGASRKCYAVITLDIKDAFYSGDVFGKSRSFVDASASLLIWHKGLSKERVRPENATLWLPSTLKMHFIRREGITFCLTPKIKCIRIPGENNQGLEIYMLRYGQWHSSIQGHLGRPLGFSAGKQCTMA